MPLSPLDFMRGRWQIDGQMHGQPITGQAHVTPLLDGSFLQYREDLGDYQDLCIYSRDPDTLDLVVHQFSVGEAVKHYTVLPLDGRPGVHWVPVGMGPMVRIFPEEGGWCTEVWLHEATSPEVSLHYRPLADEDRA